MTEGLGSYRVAIDEHHSAAKPHPPEAPRGLFGRPIRRLGLVHHREDDPEYETKDDPLAGLRSVRVSVAHAEATVANRVPGTEWTRSSRFTWLAERSTSCDGKDLVRVEMILPWAPVAPTNHIIPRVLEASLLSWEMEEIQMPLG
jgi:hypothetical protein